MNTFVTTDNASRVVVDATERFQSSGSDYVFGSAVPVHERHVEVVDAELVDEPGDVDQAPAEPRGRELVSRVVQTVTAVRVRRPVVLTLDQVVDRDRVRARRRRQARRVAVGTFDAAVQTGRGAGRVVAVVVRGTGRWVWMPDRAALVARLDADGTDTARTLREVKELGTTRRTRAGALAALGVAVGVPAWLVGEQLLDRLADAVPVYGWIGGGVAAAAGCWYAGHRDEPRPVDVDQVVMPDGLSLGDSERQVRATLADAFASQKISAQVVKVHAESWGWRVHAEIVTVLTDAHVANLALLLDTRRGGLLFSHVADSERSRVIHIVKRDLLAVGKPASPIALGEHEDIHTPVSLAPRFDGTEWMMRLAAQHIVAIGRIGSGKSTVLNRCIDALVHGGAVVGCIDLSGGADLRSWTPVMEPRLSAFGNDVPGAATALSAFVALIIDRKARLAPGTKWRSTRQDPPLRLVLDEFGLVAEHKELLDLVDYAVLYGRHVDAMLVVGNHELTVDMMKSGRLKSQAQVKIFCSMDAAAAVLLPKELRSQGVAPGQLVAATPDEPYDAGKAYVTGVGSIPFMVRFGPYGEGEAARRAKSLAAGRGRPRLSAADERVVEGYLSQNDGVPVLLLDAYDAIRAKGNRDPQRATSEEIADYLVAHGHPDITALNVSTRIRQALGGAYPADRKPDMNLDGANRKGWRLDDLERGIDKFKQLNGL